MNNFLETSIYFGVFISVFAYLIGDMLKRKFKLAIFNPLLISVIITIAVLALLGIDYEGYSITGRYITFFLTPCTVCLAVPLYEQVEQLKRNPVAIFLGILSGALASMGSILLMSVLFGLTHEEYVTFLPKSVTTAIGIGISEEIGGYVAISAASIIITGVIGNVFAEYVLKLFRIKEPIAKGIAIGSSSHALGTAKAMELGPIEGAMSSLSIVVSGLFTVIGASIFSHMY
jgi:predicted murein hydrolase (TIGR00659 family)